jgi:hypothetical protein
MKHLLMCGLLFFATGIFSFAYSQDAKNEGNSAKSGEQAVEKKYDRFKDETVVTLKPQRILDSKSPRQIIEMSIKATFKGAQPENVTDTIEIRFTSAAEKQPTYDRETLNFIVDGERVKGSQVRVVDTYERKPALAEDLKGAQEIIAFIGFPALRQVANGKKVEIGLGPTELTLDAKTLGNLRGFAAAIFGK